MPQTAEAQPSAVVVHLSDLHFSCGNGGLEERNALIRERLCADLAPLLAEDIGAKADVVERFHG